MDFDHIISLINHQQFDALDMNEEHTKALLVVLINHGWIKENQHGLYKAKKPTLVVGQLDVKETFAFLIGSNDYYVSEKYGYFTNDYVVGFIDANKPKGDEVIIIDRLISTPHQLVLKVDSNQHLISVDNAYKDYHFSLTQKLLLPIGSLIKASVSKIENKVIYLNFESEVSLNPDLDETINAILATHNISWAFDQNVINEANKLENKDYQNLKRRNLNDLIFVTIDGASSKDLDDAVYLEKTNTHYHLYVSIADVDNFVKQASDLDQSAYARGNSVYFLDYVIPMLPSVLCNGLCSLIPNVIRYTMTCEMKIDFTGNVCDYQIYPSTIISHARLTYSEVNDFLMRDEVSEHLKPYTKMLSLMDELREILFQKRSEHGAFNFEEPEVKFIVDDDHNIIDMLPIERENGEKLIEEFMILANNCVAQLIAQMEVPFVYRVHEQPHQDEFDSLITNLKNLGFNLNFSQDKRFLYPQIKKQVTDQTSLAIVEKLLVRSMPKAKYQMTNIGHFGLSIEDYTHFTSPIRRYSDLMVHRLLKRYLISCNYQFSSEELTHLNHACEHITQTEINAQRAERSIIDLKKVDYMQQFLHHEFVGRISNIYENKMVIELANSVRGNVFLTDYYDFVGVENYEVVFRQRHFKLLDEVKVKVQKVDRSKQRITFVLTDYKRRFNFNKSRRNRYGNFKTTKKNFKRKPRQ